MESITITTENHETYSAVSNFFIDYYMTEANGEFVKVYLYLIRLLNSGRAITIADIADRFNLTENDICRAIRYWIKQGVLRLDYTSDKVLTGITMLPLSPKAPNREESSLLSMLGVKEAPKAPKDDKEKVLSDAKDTEAAITAEEIRSSAVIPKKVSYKPTFIEEKKNDEDFGNLLFQTETYFGKNLSQSDVNSLLYIYEELRFSPDLLEYLVEYCVSIGKKSCRYIEAVALEWYKNNITTVEDAKAASKNFNSIYVTVLKELGIRNRVPTPAETTYIDTWYHTYSFDKNIIVEACRRAITTNPQAANFKYVNGILEKWHQQNVKNLSDITALDEQWETEKKKKNASNKTSSNNQFNNFQGATDKQTVHELETLFLQNTNK